MSRNKLNPYLGPTDDNARQCPGRNAEGPQSPPEDDLPFNEHQRRELSGWGVSNELLEEYRDCDMPLCDVCDHKVCSCIFAPMDSHRPRVRSGNHSSNRRLGNTPDDMIERIVRISELRLCFADFQPVWDELTKRQYWTVEKHYWHGMTLAEIAAEENRARSSIYYRLEGAVKKLLRYHRGLMRRHSDGTNADDRE